MTWIPEYPRILVPNEDAPSQAIEVWYGTNLAAADALRDALAEASQTLSDFGVEVSVQGETIQPYSQIGLGSNLPPQPLEGFLKRIAEYLPAVHQGGDAPFVYVYQLPEGVPSFELRSQIEKAVRHVQAQANPST